MAKRKKYKPRKQTNKTFTIKKQRGKDVFDINVPKNFDKAKAQKAIDAKMKKYSPDTDLSIRIHIHRTFKGKVITRTILSELETDLNDRPAYKAELTKAFQDAAFKIFTYKKRGGSL